MQSEPVEHLILVEHLQRIRIPNGAGVYQPTREFSVPSLDWCYWSDAITQCEKNASLSAVEWMNAEDTLFMLYTSYVVVLFLSAPKCK